ncbi:MAG: enoyl-CoA hydratase/isomerase family protein, partial [Gammaproteobacteria bacterium]
MLVVRRHCCANGMIVAEATLTAERVLNALNIEMARDLFDAAQQWHDDDAIAAVVINGAGARAFCAGGDVRQVCAAAGDDNHKAVGDYFAAEYRADFALHCLHKPLLCFAGGIVMGGGVGIMQGCNFRIATDTTLFAMPETAIGAIPDVGAAKFLRPVNGGFFLGISGAAINGFDAKAAMLADYVIADNCREHLITKLCAADWQQNTGENRRIAKTLLDDLAKAHPPQNKTMPMSQTIKQIAAVKTPADAFAVCDAGNDNPFLQLAAKKLRAASPSAMALWQRHYDSLPDASLAEVFAADYRMMTGAAAMGDFCEGVRAVLTDK